MNRRLAALIVGVLATLFALSFSSELPSLEQARAEERTNVLFIAVDDLRPDLGCYGDSVALTPNIDRLAAEGTVFDRAYTQQAVCHPSRASLLTGRRPDTINVWGMDTHFREAMPHVVTLPQYFKQQGYHTQAIGKIYHATPAMQDPPSWSVPPLYHVSVDWSGAYVLPQNRRGGSGKKTATERVDGPDDVYKDGKIADEAIKTLQQIKNRPFFLAVGFYKPHLPFNAPARYWDLYDPGRITAPSDPDPPKGVPTLALHDSKELRGYLDIPNYGPLSEEKIRELQHGYYACISYMDAQVGRLLDELDRLQLTDRTTVILWGDHGYHLGEYDLWCKTTNFERDTRVPLIVSAPGQQKRGTKTGALVELVDVYPTLVELAGFPLPDGLQGTSMVPLLNDPTLEWKQAAFSQHPRPFYLREFGFIGYSIRTDRFRYTEWLDVKTRKRVARELYDHESEPAETANVADDTTYTKHVRDLSQQLHEGWLAARPSRAADTSAVGSR